MTAFAEALMSGEDYMRQHGNGVSSEGPAQATRSAACGLTEDELAAEFTRRHRDHWRYVALWGAWMRWNGQCWQRDATLEAFDLARAVCRDAADEVVDDKLRTRLRSAATRAAVENLARSDRAHAAVPDQWDTDPFALNEPRRSA
jgi:putative DNA primase/helicase